MLFPCKDCLILAICYSNEFKKQRVSNCDLIKKFINENAFERLTLRVKKDSGKAGFTWFIADHPIRDDLVVGLYLLVHSARIWIKGAQEFAKDR